MASPTIKQRLRKLVTGDPSPVTISGTAVSVSEKKPSFMQNSGADPISTSEMLEQARLSGGGLGGVAIFSLLGNERTRAEIYLDYLVMSLDPLIKTCVSALVTAALGGDAEQGKSVFIEFKSPPNASEADIEKHRKMVAEIAADLEPIFNSVAYTVAMNAAYFGDAYARPYFVNGLGITSLEVGELVSAPMVEPFERAGMTEAYLVSDGIADFAQLNTGQMARAKMPRTAYVPQYGIFNTIAHGNLCKDDPMDHELSPSLLGGSLLAHTEKPYKSLDFLLRLLMTQRVRQSVDENIALLKTRGLDKKQVKSAIDNLSLIFERGWSALKKVITNGEIPKGKIMHILPIKEDGQIEFPDYNPLGVNVQSQVNLDDVFFYARQVAGTLGLDLSLAGFADQMAGGLGEGGFFRVSVQSAEHARSIRNAMTPFFDHLVRLHVYYKYGLDVAPTDSFWSIRYYSTISAMASEQQDAELSKMNSGATIIAQLEALKMSGLTEPVIAQILTVKFCLDEELANKIAKDLVAKAEKDAKEGGGGGGGF